MGFSAKSLFLEFDWHWIGIVFFGIGINVLIYYWNFTTAFLLLALLCPLFLLTFVRLG